MKYNEDIATEYGSFNLPTSYPPPEPFKPTPSGADYSRGYIDRSFVVKNSNGSGYEISPNSIDRINASVYTVCQLSWRISGKKDLTKVGNIVEDYGVASQNLKQIEKVKIEKRASLGSILKNPLEYWRGY